MEESLDMSIDEYQELFGNIWLFHNKQIWIRADIKISDRYEYYLDPKWENLWV